MQITHLRNKKRLPEDLQVMGKGLKELCGKTSSLLLERNVLRRKGGGDEPLRLN